MTGWNPGLLAKADLRFTWQPFRGNYLWIVTFLISYFTLGHLHFFYFL